MVARRAALKNGYEKLPRLIEEAGMRHYIAVCCLLVIDSVPFIILVLEPKVYHPYALINSNLKLLLPRSS